MHGWSSEPDNNPCDHDYGVFLESHLLRPSEVGGAIKALGSTGGKWRIQVREDSLVYKAGMNLHPLMYLLSYFFSNENLHLSIESVCSMCRARPTMYAG